MAKSRTAFQREIDDVLTEQFNNVPTVRAFLLKKIACLTQDLEEKFGDNVRVFIKGGSSLNIMKKVKSNIDPTKWSDFDNQIIINPNLPVYQWYQIFSEVHNYLKEEYMPRFQQDWEAFLTCNRKELDSFQQKGLDLFKGEYIDNKVFDFPTLAFSVSDKGSVSADVMKNKNAKDKKDTKSKKPGKPVVTHPLNLTLNKGYQGNIVFNSGSVSLHPLNHFDNAMSIPGLEDDITGLLKKQELQPDSIFYNSFFPPAPMPLDASADPNENPYSSSILINNSISKFILYRVIVRYATFEYSKDGQPRFAGGKNNRLGPEYKKFGSPMTKFRGELLDVSIPRRECYETIQQWAQVSTMPVPYQSAPKQPFTWLNVPDWRYQLNENILMILEVFDDISGSPHKFYKRVTRGVNAVEAINESFQKRYPLSSTQLQNIEKQINIKSFNQAFKTLNTHKTLGFLRPLVKDLFDIIQNDYGWKHLASSMKKFKLKKAIDVEAIVGDDIVKALADSWRQLQTDRPDKTSSKTYDDILIKEVKDKDDKRTQSERDVDYDKAKMMLSFMRFYHNIHQAFASHLTLSEKPVDPTYDIKSLNDFRSELEALSNVEHASLCGILSSMVQTKVTTGTDSFHYHLPYVEIFASLKANETVQTLQKALTKNPSIAAMGDLLVADESDFRSLPSLIVQLNGFALPVVIRALEANNIQDAIREASLFKKNEDKLAEDLSAIRVKSTGVRRQMSRLLKLKQQDSEARRFKEDENYVFDIFDPYSDTELMQSLSLELQQYAREAKEKVAQADANSYKKQLLYSFSPVGSVCFIRHDGSEYRILLSSEAVKHMDMTLTFTESYYQTHWLDHVRKDFKEVITQFPPRRKDLKKSDISIYTTLFEPKEKLSFSAVASSDFSKPIQYQAAQAAAVVTQIRGINSWANVGGDIAPLLMSQLLQCPIEVASAGSSQDVREGRLTQINLFDRNLRNDFQLENMNPFNFNLNGEVQHLSHNVTVIKVAKIGNHYWLRNADGTLGESMPEDGNCFYHAIIRHLAPSVQLPQNNPRTAVTNLRGALANYADNLSHQPYLGSNRLQYIIDNIGALENSFRPILGYQEVALRDVAALHRGIIRNIKSYLTDGGRGDQQDIFALHEIISDAIAVNTWTAPRQTLIQQAQQFVRTSVRPQANTLPTDGQLEIN